MNTMNILSEQERLVLLLRELYQGHGCVRFPMRRFEEYALYLENKSFLTSEQVLSFTDGNGKLMALKPDVTLSIVKHARRGRECVEKLYYHESVYRASPTDHEFKEIEQIGVEYLGNIDRCATGEVMWLALESLRMIGREYVMDISHMGLTAGLMNDCGLDGEAREEAFRLIRQKNVHELRAMLTAKGLGTDTVERFAALLTISGTVEEMLEKAAQLTLGEASRKAVEELSQLYSDLRALGMESHVRLDFSIANDLDYYNGLVFRGYVEGAPRAVLSGGRYDHLMAKMGKDADGFGFALYLDELNSLATLPSRDEVDVLAQYAPEDDAAKVLTAVKRMRELGLRVLATCGEAPQVYAYRHCRFDGERFVEVE
ncbi:MAG: hypothetical protein E7319_00860 [Clostridiales bacterium]|nr:hypothetical protein [Clostridiales bacterium]